MTRIEDKALLRADAFRRRKEGIAALDREAVAARLLRHFESILPSVGEIAGDSPVAAGFWPIGDEIDVRPALVRLTESGWDCALPVTPPPGRPLGFRRWTHGDATVRGRFGTSEPGPEAEILTPVLLIVPLLAFDRHGGRIGYGAGYYDRTIAALRSARPTVTVGAAYALQEIASVPVDERDQPLDWVVTEKEAIDCRAWGRSAAGSAAS